METFGAQAVLFDLDGVITPTADLHMKAWAGLFRPYFAEHGVAEYTDPDYFRFLDGKPRTAGIGSLLEDRGLRASDLEIESLGERKNELFLDLLSHGIEPYPASVRYIDALDAAGIAKAVVSSSKNAGQVLSAAGLRNRFPVLVDGALSASRGLPGKPAPDTYEYGAKLLGVPTSQSVVIEDAVSGVRAGAAGDFAAVVGVDRGAGEDALREAGATMVVRELDELLA